MYSMRKFRRTGSSSMYVIVIPIDFGVIFAEVPRVLEEPKDFLPRRRYDRRSFKRACDSSSCRRAAQFTIALSIPRNTKRWSGYAAHQYAQVSALGWNSTH